MNEFAPDKAFRVPGIRPVHRHRPCRQHFFGPSRKDHRRRYQFESGDFGNEEANRIAGMLAQNIREDTANGSTSPGRRF